VLTEMKHHGIVISIPSCGSCLHGHRIESQAGDRLDGFHHSLLGLH
jgi:hypothetical protein